MKYHSLTIQTAPKYLFDINFFLLTFMYYLFQSTNMQQKPNRLMLIAHFKWTNFIRAEAKFKVKRK